MTFIDPSWSAHWCERPSGKLQVHTSQIKEIADHEAVHALQRFTRTWRLHAGDSAVFKKLRLATPGLTIVRVDPTIGRGDAMIARVRVTSDESQHIDRVQLVTKKHNELRVEFTNASNHGGEVEMGSLVVEIDLVHAQQVEQVLAMGGGNVTIQSGVLVNSIHRSGLLVALHESQLVIDERSTRHLQLKELFMGSAGDGEVYLQSDELTLRETLACGVLGNGRIHVIAPRTWAAASQVAAVGDQGSIQIRATRGFATEELTGVVKGSGECIIQSSPAVEFGNHTTCRTQHLTVEGFGLLDVAGIPAECCRIKARGGGRVVAQPRQKLRFDLSSSDTIVECVGVVPPDTQKPKSANTIACVSYHDRLAQQRIQEATHPTAAMPERMTIETAFDSPQELHVTEAGFRATFLQPFLNAM